MSSKSSNLSFLILLTTITPLLSLIPPPAPHDQQANKPGNGIGFTTQLIHRDNPQSPSFNHSLSKSDRIIASIQRSRSRSLYLSNRGRNHIDAFQAPLKPDNWEFVLSFYIGTPPVQHTAIVDTGGEYFWLQCLPCPDEDCFTQRDPIFDPSLSVSYRNLTCTERWCDEIAGGCDDAFNSCLYEAHYEDKSYSKGNFANETFTFGGYTISEVVFGCGHENVDTYVEEFKPSGNLGLSRARISFLKQKHIESFSYCLVEDKQNYNSWIHFQNEAGELGGQSTKLVDMDEDDSPLYYLDVEGISVGDTKLPLPEGFFEVTDDEGHGGFIIDSGASYTHLKSQAYEMLIDEMKRKITSLTEIKNLRTEADPPHADFGLCYTGTIDAVKQQAPDLTFHMADGLDLVLNKEGTWVDMGDGVRVCLAILEETGNDIRSIFGNFQQINMNIHYDLVNEEITFTRMASCNNI